MSDDYELSPLEDATIEDTVFCGVCGCQMTLGGNEAVVLDGSKVRFRPEFTGCVCIGCAGEVHRAYEASCDDAGLCVHGGDDDGRCSECNREWKERGLLLLNERETHALEMMLRAKLAGDYDDRGDGVGKMLERLHKRVRKLLG
jgi:hypothetical protein